MIPVVAGPAIGQTTEVETKAGITSATWEIDFSAGRIKGLVDGLSAMRQAIQMALMTPRFERIIYSWDYGMESPSPDLVSESEIKRVIREALLADARVLGVDGFTIERLTPRAWKASFRVQTIYGETQEQSEVTVGV